MGSHSNPGEIVLRREFQDVICGKLEHQKLAGLIRFNFFWNSIIVKAKRANTSTYIVVKYHDIEAMTPTDTSSEY